MEGAALSAPALRTMREGHHPGVQARLRMGRHNDIGADRAAPSIEWDATAIALSPPVRKEKTEGPRVRAQAGFQKYLMAFCGRGALCAAIGFPGALQIQVAAHSAPPTKNCDHGARFTDLSRSCEDRTPAAAVIAVRTTNTKHKIAQIQLMVE